MATKETKLQIVVDAQNRTQGAFDRVQNDLDAVRTKHQGLISAMKGVGVAGTVAFGGLALVTKGAVQAGADFEQTQIAFETMLGSAELAQKTLAQLADFAAKTPFELDQVEDASKQLIAYGFSAEELIPTMRNLGNVAAALKIPMGDMAYLFGTLRTQGRAFSKDIYQFTNRGIPIVAELATVLGVAESQVMGLVEEGKVGFAEVEQALANMNAEGGKFFNLMDAQSASLGGMWSNLKDEIALTARAIGQELIPYLKPLVEQLISVAQGIGEWVKEHPRLAAFLLMLTLGLTAILALLLPLAMALPGLIIMWGGLTAALAAFVAISAPVLLAIGAVVAAFTILATQGYLTKEAWQNVWLGIKLIAADAANAVIGTVEAMINFVLEGVNRAIRAINSVIRAAQKVPGIGKNLSTIGEIKADFGRIDTDTIAADDISSRGNAWATAKPFFNMAGSVFLSADVAEQIGDLIMGQLKKSNAI